jgi:hypothetical protein
MRESEIMMQIVSSNPNFEEMESPVIVREHSKTQYRRKLTLMHMVCEWCSAFERND